MVLRRCRWMLKDEERARDAMHDVFVRLMKYEHQLKDTYPSSLLYTMATNICLNIIRSRKLEPDTGVDERLLDIAKSEEPEAGWGARLLLQKLFKKEQASTRTMAVLHYLDGMTLEETAREVKLSVSGVRKRLRNLRQSLRELEGAENE
jgi:RNA polymerase sigma factor (sigma-70 family)